MKTAQNEKIENPTEEQMVLDLTVSNNIIYLPLYFIIL